MKVWCDRNYNDAIDNRLTKIIIKNVGKQYLKFVYVIIMFDGSLDVNGSSDRTNKNQQSLLLAR